jgi:hypothetical protein
MSREGVALLGFWIVLLFRAVLPKISSITVADTCAVDAEAMGKGAIARTADLDVKNVGEKTNTENSSLLNYHEKPMIQSSDLLLQQKRERACSHCL